MGRLGYILQWVFSWDTYAFLWLWRIILLLLVGGAEIFRKKRITHIAIFMVRPPPYSAFVFPSFWVSTTLLKYFHVVGCLRFFSMNSLHNFLNEFVVLFLLEHILLLYFFQFLGQYACIDHLGLYSPHGMQYRRPWNVMKWEISAAINFCFSMSGKVCLFF